MRIAGQGGRSGFVLSRRDVLLTSAVAGAATLTTGLHAEGRSPQSGLARSRQGMVTSPHDLASQAGLEVLQAGGNAIEAAIAIGATLCVTYPHFSSLGGDAFMIISDRKGNAFTLSGVGQAAAKPPAYGEELCWNLGDAVIRRRSVLACR